MGGIIFTIGGLICLVAYIMILIQAFKKSIVWGLVVLLLCWLGMLIFAIMNLPTAKKALLIFLVGFVLEVIGGFLGGAAAFMAMRPARG